MCTGRMLALLFKWALEAHPLLELPSELLLLPPDHHVVDMGIVGDEEAQ